MASQEDRAPAIITEDQAYEIVAAELQQGIRKDGIWVKAFSQAVGDENKANAIYIELRKWAILDENKAHVKAHAAKHWEDEPPERKTFGSQVSNFFVYLLLGTIALVFGLSILGSILG